MCTSYTLTPTFPPRAPFYLLNRENARLALIRGRKLGVGRMGGREKGTIERAKKSFYILNLQWTTLNIKNQKMKTVVELVKLFVSEFSASS